MHAVAEGAGEMMLAATYAIQTHTTIDDLADTWADVGTRVGVAATLTT